MSVGAMFAAAAVVLTTVGWIPQISRSVRSGSADDFSTGYLTLFTSGVTCWLVYGLIKGDPALIVANALAVLALATIVSVKVRSHLLARRRNDGELAVWTDC